MLSSTYLTRTTKATRVTSLTRTTRVTSSQAVRQSRGDPFTMHTLICTIHLLSFSHCTYAAWNGLDNTRCSSFPEDPLVIFNIPAPRVIFDLPISTLSLTLLHEFLPHAHSNIRALFLLHRTLKAAYSAPFCPPRSPPHTAVSCYLALNSKWSLIRLHCSLRSACSAPR